MRNVLGKCLETVWLKKKKTVGGIEFEIVNENDKEILKIKKSKIFKNGKNDLEICGEIWHNSLDDF